MNHRKWLARSIASLAILFLAFHAMMESIPTSSYVQQWSHTGPFGPRPWQITFPAKSSIEGYASTTSAAPGEIIDFFINTKLPFRVQFYRMGYVDQKETPLVGELIWMKKHEQKKHMNTENMDANWDKTFSYAVPGNWKSGCYLAKLIDKQERESYIPFVIHDKNPTANFGIMISSNTYHAYNNWGGKSLYEFSSTGKKAAHTVSFNRPYNEACGAGKFFIHEYPLIHWLERKGYHVTYFSDTDVHNGILDNSSIQSLLIPGHNEYWSKEMRDSIEKHIDKGMNLALFSANTGYWQVRLEQHERHLVCYRNPDIDPMRKTDAKRVTTRFRDKPIHRPEDTLFGVMYQGIPDIIYPMVIGNTDHWIFKGTTLKKGDHIDGIIGGEIDNNMRKVKQSHVITRSPINLSVRSKFRTEAWSNVKPKDTYSDMVWMERPGKGNVFSTGTFLWQMYLETKLPWIMKNNNIETMTMNVLNRLKRRP